MSFVAGEQLLICLYCKDVARLSGAVVREPHCQSSAPGIGYSCCFRTGRFFHDILLHLLQQKSLVIFT